MEQRRADALVEMTGAYLSDGNGATNGGDRPRINLVLDYQTLLDGLAPATLPPGSTPVNSSTHSRHDSSPATPTSSPRLRRPPHRPLVA